MIGVFVAWGDRVNAPGWVVEESGCHVWIGSHNERGYGYVREGDRVRRVHRVRYEREVGPIPAGMDLDHICANRSCCNPAHLRPTTHRENLLRGDTIAAASAARTHCPAGHALVEQNLRPGRLKKGERVCRICLNERENAKYAERKNRHATPHDGEVTNPATA